jgi:ribosomal protein L29
MLTTQELRQLQGKELLEEIAKTSRELMRSKIEHSSKTLKETHQLKTLKRYIARMKTIEKQNEKEAKAKL